MVADLAQQLATNLALQQARYRHEVADLRNSVVELGTPVLPVWPGVLVVPLSGRIDEQRAEHMRGIVLQRVEQTRASKVIFDVTGVLILDSQASANLRDLMRAVTLLGASCSICGIRPEVADAIVSVGMNLKEVRAYPDLQESLAAVIGVQLKQGYRW